MGFVDPFGLEILVQAHPVAFGMDHAKLTIIPDNQARYQSDPRFSNTLSDGRRYATIGAGPIDGLLVSGINRPRDIQLWRNNYSDFCELPSGQSEDDVIDQLFDSVDNYDNSVDYDFFPSMQDGHNSNSFVRGLMNATGLRGKLPISTEGAYQPVPQEEFK